MEPTDNHTAERAPLDWTDATVFRAIIDRADEGVVLVERGVVGFVNRWICELLGWPAGEVAGRSFTEFLDPSDVAPLVERYQRRMAGEDVPSLDETQLRCRNGEVWPVEVSAGLVRHQGRTIDTILVRDIRVRREAAAREATRESFVRTLFEAVPVPLFYKDAQGRYLGCNKAFEASSVVRARRLSGGPSLRSHCPTSPIATPTPIGPCWMAGEPRSTRRTSREPAASAAR
jgi:PAS domain S-box-containing protein